MRDVVCAKPRDARPIQHAAQAPDSAVHPRRVVKDPGYLQLHESGELQRRGAGGHHARGPGDGLSQHQFRDAGARRTPVARGLTQRDRRRIATRFVTWSCQMVSVTGEIMRFLAETSYALARDAGLHRFDERRQPQLV